MIVTITCKEGRKIIDRFDVDLPSEAKYISQDGDGEYWYYTKKPLIRCDGLFGWWNSYGGKNVEQIHKGIQNRDWKDSLIKVSDIK